jgi:hypothetical protein
MSHEQMLRAEKELENEINALMSRAEILDAQEDRRYGKGKLGSELPDALRHRLFRLAKIRQIRKEMEADTAAAQESDAAAAEQAELNKRLRRQRRRQKPRGRMRSSPPKVLV